MSHFLVLSKDGKKISEEKFTKRVLDAAQAIQSAYDNIKAKGGTIEKLKTRFETRNLDNGTYKIKKQSYKMYVDNELMLECQTLLDIITRENTRRGTEGVDLFPQQLVFVNSLKIKCIVIASNDWYDLGPALIYTAHQSHIKSTKSLSIEDAEADIAEDIKSEHYEKLDVQLTTADLAKIEASKHKADVSAGVIDMANDEF